jgi:hypothetical protein
MNLNQLPQVMGLAQQVVGQVRSGNAVSPAAGDCNAGGPACPSKASIYNMGYRDGLGGQPMRGNFSGNGIYQAGYKRGVTVRANNPT